MAFLVVSCGGSEQQLDSAHVAGVDNVDKTSSSATASPDSSVDAPDGAENGTVPGIIAGPTTAPGVVSGTSGDENDATNGDRGGRTAATTPTPRSPTPSSGDGSSTAAAAPSPTVAGDPASTPTGRPTVTSSPAQNVTPATSPTASPTATVMPPTVTPPPMALAKPTYFQTLPPGSALPTDAECAAAVRAHPSPETHPGNASSNARTGGPQVLIDGAEGFRGDRFARRITGNFTGTTDEILRWVSCKWGIDEDITRARAWTESSWRISTAGDQTDLATACAYLGLPTPCPQSYGLLQVKGTIHEGTYPFSFQSTAWGVDYAMAWQRACFEGAFTWLDDQGYAAGDLIGCVGAWYSGEWFDSGANKYLVDVAENLARRPWE